MNYALSTEHGLRMSGPMALAAYRGVKTQARTPIKPQPSWDDSRKEWTLETQKSRSRWTGDAPLACALQGLRGECPFGCVGERVYVRETWRPSISHHCVEDACDCGDVRVRYDADGTEIVFPDSDAMGDWTMPAAARRGNLPSIHMPKWAARTWGTIVNVCVERLLEISAKEILAEGAVSRPHNDSILGKCPVSAFDGRVYPDLMSLWVAGWDSIYTGELSSKHSPFVWVIEWKKG